jgi:hypothetical protein
MPETSSLQGPLGTLVLGATFVLLTGALEVIARIFSPPPKEDPRLGVIGFWASVAVAACATPILGPLLERPGNWLDRMVALAWACMWVAWKTGLLREPKESQRDHEQMWALTVGCFVGFLFIAPHWSIPL